MCLSLEIGSLRVSVVKRKSYWRRAALNSVTRVLEEGGEDRDPRGSHVTAKAEIRAMCVQGHTLALSHSDLWRSLVRQ